MHVDPKTIVLDDGQRAEIADLAERTGKPWPVIFTEALARYRREKDADADIETGESLLDAASRLGLVGCLRSGITDLTTNPIHMEGFGADDC